MHIVAKKLSEETIAAITHCVWTVKQGLQKFQEVYDLTMRDVAGHDWRETWRQWDNFDVLVGNAERQLKAVATSAGLDEATFSRYVKAARKWAFLSIPMSLANSMTVKQIRMARDQAAADTGPGTAEQKLERALKEQRDAKIARNNVQAAERNGATVLMPPTDRQTADAYFRQTVTQVLAHFGREDVAGLLTRQQREALTVLEQAVAAVKGRKRKSA